jgi:integrase/recombinase XerC
MKVITMTTSNERNLPAPIVPAAASLTAAPSTDDAARRLVEAFLAGRNERTMQAYHKDLIDFKNFTSAGDIDEAAHLLLSRGHGAANELVLRYRAHLVERGLAAATVNRRLAALRSMVKLAGTLGMVPWKLEIPGLKSQPYRDTRGPGVDGFRALLKALEGRQDAKASRDRAILWLLYSPALRRGEVVALDLEDVDLGAGTASILGKGRSERETLTLPAETVAALREWIEARGPEQGPLFTNFDRAGKGQRITGTSIYRMVRKLGQQAGINTRPHGLRHAAITEALDKTNGDLRATARFSRHKDIRTLGHYDDNRQDLGGEVAKIVAESV